jgi:hypothetical protein
MPYTHRINPEPYPAGTVLTSGDLEPCGGTMVRDAAGTEWIRDSLYEGPANWYPLIPAEPGWYRDADVETWTHVAGNHGPVTVTEAPSDDDVETARRWLT